MCHRRVQLGVEVNPEVDEVNPLLSVFLLFETAGRPAVFLGTSSDRIGSPEGTQAYYATASKRFGESRFSAYASLNYSEWDDGFNLPFGFEVDLGRGFSVRPMWDGAQPHLDAQLLSRALGVSLLAVDLEYPGISFAMGF